MHTKKNKVSYQEIAQQAGVSVATVSRAVHRSTRVKAGTVDTIAEAMRKLDDHRARAFENDLILVLLPSMESAFYEEISRGITNSAASHELLVALVRTGKARLTAEELKHILSRTRAKAAILLSPIQPDGTVSQLAKTIPVVQCGAIDVTEGISCVTIDEQAVCKAVTAYFYACGRKRIVMMSGLASRRRIEQRTQGYRLACEEAERTPSHEQFTQLQVPDLDAIFPAVEQMFCVQEQPDAIFAASDEIAIAAVKAVKRLGLTIPEQVGIVGLNNVGWREYSDPVLTTVHLPLYRMGFLSGELAASGIGKGGAPRHITVETEILKRDS